jgi:uncharacterized membrane protein
MKLDKIVSILLAIIIIIAVSATIYIIVNPAPNETFTEFYILGENGKAGNYSTSMNIGETSNLTIGIVNHEYKNTSYHVVVKNNDKTVFEKNITLQNNEKIEIPYEFTASQTGSNKLDLFLYKLPDEKNVYRSLDLPVNVS